MKQKGWFIVFEGLDKAGKTTQINLFREFLKKRNIPFLFTREPGGTDVGEKIRTLLLDPQNKMNPMCEAMLYAAARSELVQTVLKPSIEGGQNVVCDRYVDSSIAYQGFGRELGMDRIKNLNMFATDGMTPDLTIYLSLSVSEANSRTSGAKDRIEGAEASFHERVHQGYQTLYTLEPNRFCVIDAKKDIEQVHREIVCAFSSRFLP